MEVLYLNLQQKLLYPALAQRETEVQNYSSPLAQNIGAWQNR